ncbi:hypothetical protein ACS0TY_020541 [Phlomoides rotata]
MMLYGEILYTYHHCYPILEQDLKGEEGLQKEGWVLKRALTTLSNEAGGQRGVTAGGQSGVMKRQKRAFHCRKCGVGGHNSVTCKSNEAGEQRGVAAGSQSGVAAGSKRGVAAGSKRSVAAGSQSGVAAGSKRGVACGSQSGVALSDQVSTKRAIRKKLAPPSVPPVTPNADEGGISDIAT